MSKNIQHFTRREFGELLDGYVFLDKRASKENKKANNRTTRKF